MEPDLSWAMFTFAPDNGYEGGCESMASSQFSEPHYPLWFNPKQSEFMSIPDLSLWAFNVLNMWTKYVLGANYKPLMN